MDIKALRQKVLDLAIRGKLVPQNPNDEPASVLLEKIRQEKEQMVKEGKLKKKDIKDDTVIFKGEDGLYYEQFKDGKIKCINDEILFEVPEGWEWCRLGVYTINRDSERKPLSKANRDKIKKIFDYYGATGKIDKVDNYIFNEKLLLVGEDGANLLSRSKPAAFLVEGKYWVNNHAHCVDTIDKKLLCYIELYINAIDLKKYVTGSAQPKLNQDNMNSIIISIPPFKEQQHIVEKIESIFKQIDILEHEKEEVQSLIKLSKNKLLDLAIRGQLVPQDANDEPASVLLEKIREEKEQLVKEGKLKPKDIKNDTIIFKGEDGLYYEQLKDGKVKCIDSEIPFEIPEGWEWCRLSSITVKEIKRGKAAKYSEKGSVLVFAQKCNRKLGGISLELAKYLDETTLNKYSEEEFLLNGDIVINSTGTGTIGRVGIINRLEKVKIVPDSHITIVRAYKCILNKYVYFFLKTKQDYLEKSGEGSTNQKELKPKTIKEILFPLPPFNEQQRIVEKLEQLFAQIDRIETNLQ